jgi:hypothetical protein
VTATLAGLCAPAAALGLGFTPAPGSPIPVGSRPFGLASADFNNDGKPDLVAAASSDANIALLLNRGDGTGRLDAQLPVVFAGNELPSGVTAGDLNHDGLPDAIAALFGGGNGTKIAVLLNSGGSLGTPITYPSAANNPPAPGKVALGDLNGDGWLDVVSSNAYGGGASSVSVYINKANGTGALNAATNYPVGGTSVGHITTADFNDDGKADVAVADPGGNRVVIMAALANGSGGLSTPQGVPTGAGPTGLASADLNADGRPDFVAANNNASNGATLTEALNTGSGLTHFATPIVPQGPSAVAAGDLTADGSPDIAVTLTGASGTTGTNVAVLPNAADGSGSLGAPQTFTVGSRPQVVALADFDGDGELDIATGNDFSGDVSVLLSTNAGAVAFTPSAEDFGSALVGTSVDREVTITNSGTGFLRLDSISIAGGQAPDFTVAHDGCSGKTLRVGATCIVGLRFTPAAAGTRSASLVVADNAPGSPHSLALSGTGTVPPPPPSPKCSLRPQSRLVALGASGRGSRRKPATLALRTSVKCDRAARGTLRATISVPAPKPKRSRRRAKPAKLKLAALNVGLKAGKSRTADLRLSARQVALVRQADRAGRHSKATLALTARPAVGQPGVAGANVKRVRLPARR